MLDDKPLTMEVDTGASVSLVSRETFQLKKVLKPTCDFARHKLSHMP